MNIQIIRGDTYKITFTIRANNNSHYLMQDIDKLYFTVKKQFENTNAILQKTFGNGISYNDITNEYEINLTQADTYSLPKGGYVFDIKIIIQGINEVVAKTLAKGIVEVSLNATHKENE